MNGDGGGAVDGGAGCSASGDLDDGGRGVGANLHGVPVVAHWSVSQLVDCCCWCCCHHLPIGRRQHCPTLSSG